MAQYVVNLDALNDISVRFRDVDYRVAESSDDLTQSVVDQWRKGWKTQKAATGLEAGHRMVKALLPDMPHAVIKELSSPEVTAIYQGIAAARAKAARDIAEAEGCEPVKVDVDTLGDNPLEIRWKGQHYECFHQSITNLKKLDRLVASLNKAHVNDKPEKRRELVRLLVPDVDGATLESLTDDMVALLIQGITSAVSRQVQGWMRKNGLGPNQEEQDLISGIQSLSFAPYTTGDLSMLHERLQSMRSGITSTPQ